MTLVIQPSKITETTGNKWHAIGTLPETLWPAFPPNNPGSISFVAYDNQTSTWDGSKILDMGLGSGGGLIAYVYPDHLTFQPYGSITYISKI